jgi:uroporphyrinogen-III synthase
MKLFITRPLEDALPLAAKLLVAGHETVIAPLLAIVLRAGVAIPPDRFQAICVTSANGVRCLQGQVDLQVPVLAVGAQSAAAAKLRGFEQVTARGGDVRGLVEYIRTALIPQDGPLLYLSGAETSDDLEGQLTAAGFSVTRLITYDAVAQKLDGFQQQLHPGNGVLLYSPRSAKLWRAEMARMQLDPIAAQVKHFCLSPQVAAALPPEFPAIAATSPDEPAMLALLDLAGKAE